jgi:hypothetical protein
MALIKLNLDPSTGELRKFGFIALAVFAAAGLLVWLRATPLSPVIGESAGTVARALWVIGGLSGGFSLIAPRANRPLFVTMSVVGFPIGLAISYASMAALFFLVMAPFGVIRRVVAGDPLARRLDRSAPTYWVPHKRVRGPQRYFSQY